MRYLIKQKYFALNDTFNITDDNGRAAYKVNSKLVSVPKKFTLGMPDGREMLLIRKKIRLGFTKFEVFWIQGGENKKVATIHRKFKCFGSKVELLTEIPELGNCTLTGSITSWSFNLVRDEDSALLASISKKWIKIADTYAVDVAEVASKYDYLVLALAICVDYMFHPKH